MTENNEEDFGGDNRRRSKREVTRRIVLLVAENGVVDGNTIDLSLEGFGGFVDSDLKMGDIVHVYIHGDDQEGGGRAARVVRKIDTGGIGFEYLPDGEDE